MKTLSKSEINLLTRLEFVGKEIYTRKDIVSFCKDKEEASYLIKKLLEKGRLKKIIKNTYFFIPMKAPDGMWAPNEYIIAKALARNSNYYIGYVTVFNSYGFTDQVAQQINIFNDKYSAKKIIFGLTYKLIKVLQSKLYGFEKRKINNEEIVFPKKERAIIDVFEFYDTDYAYEILRDQIKKLDVALVVKYLAIYPVQKIRRRIGYLLETLGADESMLNKIKVGEKGYALLREGCSNKGKINKRWRIVING